MFIRRHNINWILLPHDSLNFITGFPHTWMESWSWYWTRVQGIEAFPLCSGCCVSLHSKPFCLFSYRISPRVCLLFVLWWYINTSWGRDNFVTLSQTTFSNAFSWMKICEFRLIVHLNLFLRIKSTIFQHWFSQLLGDDQATTHYLNQLW